MSTRLYAIQVEVNQGGAHDPRKLKEVQGDCMALLGLFTEIICGDGANLQTLQLPQEAEGTPNDAPL